MVRFENCGMPLNRFGDASFLRLRRALPAPADNPGLSSPVWLQYCGRHMDRAFISSIEMNQFRDKFAISHGDDDPVSRIARLHRDKNPPLRYIMR